MLQYHPYVLEKNNLSFSRGLKIDHISTEDCVPCFEVYSDVKIAKKKRERNSTKNGE